MFKSFLRAASVAALVIGTVIGAGFATGREVVSFFGSTPDVSVALFSAVLVFITSALFLEVGRRINSNDISTSNQVLFGKLKPAADILTLFNSMAVFGVMLAGFDSIGAEFHVPRPVFAVLGGVLCAVFAHRGIKILIKINSALVPIMITVIGTACALQLTFPIVSAFNVKFGGVMLYVSMNMVLGGATLTTVHNLSKREIILSSALAAGVIGVLLFLLSSAITNTSASVSDMPILVIALKSSPALYYVVIATIVLAIFTTAAAAFKAVFDYIQPLVKSKLFAAALVTLGGLIVAYFGFTNVIDVLYPALGVIGACYCIAALRYICLTNGTKINAPMPAV